MRSLPNILVVDDGQENILYLKALLKRVSANIICAESGSEALEITKGIELSLAILDIKMPGMDGYLLAEKLNEERQQERLPIIFVTSMLKTEGNVIEGYTSGAVDVITKPIVSFILLSKVNVFLELYWQKQIVKEQLKELQEKEEKSRKILNASPEGIVLTDHRGIITEVSKVALLMLGAKDPGNLRGKHFLRIISQDSRANNKEFFEETLKTGIVQNKELVLKKINQQVFLGELSCTFIDETVSGKYSFMIIIRDISMRKQMESQAILSDRMFNLGKMASGIAHEINQPLNSIALGMDNLLYTSKNKSESFNSDYLKKKSERIFENISRIKNIIDHIRLFSRSQDDVISSNFDINESINGALSLVNEQFRNSGIKLEIDLSGIPMMMMGNKYKLEQVVLNLLTNSSDAVNEKKMKLMDSEESLISVKSYRQNEESIIEVSDNGIGIPEDQLNKVLLPFYTKKEYRKGSGLGLSISYQIVHEMQGNIEIKSEENKGTCVLIKIKTQNFGYGGTREN